jgi:hypothetical protein
LIPGFWLLLLFLAWFFAGPGRRPQSFYESERSWLTILPIDEMLSNAMHQTMQVGGSVSQLVR